MDKLLAQLSDMLLWAKENIHKDLELDSGCISRQRHHLFLVFEDLRLFSLNYSDDSLQCLHQEDIILQIRAQHDIYEKARVLLRKTDWCSANGLWGIANKGTFSTGPDQKQGRVLPLPVELQEMLNSWPSRLHLWLAKRNWALKMKHLVPQFPSILAIYCFCMLQIPSSVGFPRPLADPPDGLDVMQLERLAYWATLSRQLKDNQDIYKRFLFHYSRTQKPTQPVKSGIPPVHPLMRLAAQLEDRRVKRFPQQRDSGTATVDFTKKPRNGRNTDDNTQ
ncbi:neuromedin-S isoform X3 [Mirounga angustirostris]|uniref:neuromedin-S isoform X4 n=1 Tax=Mirounga leonina TaxID=9715 RepID=UPI00156BF9D2|nr:neuromedin-S isoform X4 [Mirounga leonina]XP_045741140.1 neuromedin-S isoform X3 [Mirounga angustirostris]